MKTGSLCAGQNRSTLLHEGAVPYITFPLLTQTGMVRHGFSTRLGGVSSGIYESMNLDFRCSEPRENVWENYRRITGVLQIPFEDLVLSAQTHTTNIRRMTAADRGKGFTRERDYTDVDGMITDEPGVALVGLFADCVPLMFVDPVHRAIGLSHAGWRGTVGKIGEKTVRAMAEAFDTIPKDLYCAVGPSICRDCYEVSADVAQAFAEAFCVDLPVCLQAGSEHTDRSPQDPCAKAAYSQNEPGPANPESSAASGDGSACTAFAFGGRRAADILTPRPGGKYLLDLHLANALTLVSAGVSTDHIAVTDLCTCCMSDLLWSHRATHGQRGEMAAIISLI